MTVQPHTIATRHTGFGLGLRTPHYADFLAAKQPLDWLEIITDNFLVQGGKPLVMLDRIRRDYPIAMHGVAMSIGAPGGVDLDYLQQVKTLAQRIEPLWVSDHLCWVGPGPEQLHDLYPLPYTDEAARHVVAQIRRAQDVLGRRLVLENVSSYIDYKQSTASEWQFLTHIANEADCLLLVDVNNIYVSSVNHGFDPLDYLRALPAHRVQQIHLAGHSDNGNHVVDTHDHPVAPAVWDVYAHACRLFGSVATMIERDAHIPPLAELLAEMDVARGIALSNPAEECQSEANAPGSLQPIQAHFSAENPSPTLAELQRRLADHVLDRGDPQAHSLINATEGFGGDQRLGIYHHAYRARLSEVLADSFAKTNLFMGSDTFDEHAAAFAVAHPPLTRSLSRYGADFPAYLAGLYPANPELHELAQLDWDLRACFDGPDVPVLTTDAAHADTDNAWLQRRHPLHPSLCLRKVTTNVVQLWNAIDADQPVPEVEWLAEPSSLIVWRKGLQPHFQTLATGQAPFVHCLLTGHSIQQACDDLAGSDALQDPAQLGEWLRDWLNNGVLRAT
jgi:uncharacterized protein (UPF0276 family)